jgi:tRNA dimethylallyltransferase
VGPTATGKSDLAVAIAERLGGEVVNADSMQLYRGMDVGTAKLTPAERRGVPHHLLDVLDVREEASVAAYQQAAREVLGQIAARDQGAVLVGGSGLYVAAVVDDLAFPGTDPEVRARLEDELAREGAVAMHARLQRVDPEAAATILPGNVRRVVRALEVVELTGQPFRASLPRPGPRTCASGGDGSGPWLRLGLTLTRDRLDERIAARVDRMWQLGLVDEAETLAAQGLRQGRTASRALGYAQVLRLLDGEIGDDEARAQTVRATARFARRQQTWFRRDSQIHWLDATSPRLLDDALAAVRAG